MKPSSGQGVARRQMGSPLTTPVERELRAPCRRVCGSSGSGTLASVDSAKLTCRTLRRAPRSPSLASMTGSPQLMTEFANSITTGHYSHLLRALSPSAGEAMLDHYDHDNNSGMSERNSVSIQVGIDECFIRGTCMEPPVSSEADHR